MSSLQNDVISIYCTSNERQYLSLANDVFDYYNIHKCEKLYAKKTGIFDIYFSFVHISLNFAPNNLKYSMDVDDI